MSVDRPALGQRWGGFARRERIVCCQSLVCASTCRPQCAVHPILFCCGFLKVSISFLLSFPPFSYFLSKIVTIKLNICSCPFVSCFGIHFFYCLFFYSFVISLIVTSYLEGNQQRLWIVSKFSLPGLITTGIIYTFLKFCLLTLCPQSFPQEYLSLLASVVLSELCVLDKLLVILQTASFHHFAYIISNPSTRYFDKHLCFFFSLLFPCLFFFCSRKKLF